ncbi:MAG: tetratricopeptide repeat protein [Gemmatimonadetes bacterium]|nr:tetratricopeptide repeat protein [Gemmatimonadota bacterium]
MIGTRFLRASRTLAMAVLLGTPYAPSSVEGQQGQARILVVNLTPTDASRADFGEGMSDRLRDIIDLPTHVAMSTQDIEREVGQFGLGLRNLDCITAVQLASAIMVPLIFCGEYRTEGSMVRAVGKYITVPANEEFVLEPDPVAANAFRALATTFRDFLEETAETLVQIDSCGKSYRAKNLDEALQFCTRAVELAPKSKEARSNLARAFMELMRYPESLREFEDLLGPDPYNTSILETAGWVAAQEREYEKSRSFYGRYLEVNAADIEARVRIASDLATMGDDRGAMGLLEIGLQATPNSPDLNLLYGAMAFRAASTLETAQPQANPDAPIDSVVVAGLYRASVKAHEIALDSVGADMPPGEVANMLRSYVKIGEVQSAITLGQRVVPLFPSNTQILGEHAAAYTEAGMFDQAIAALQRVLELQPDFTDGRTRLATVFLSANRVDDGAAWIARANEAGERDPDALAQILIANGYQERMLKMDIPSGIKLFVTAKGLAGISEIVSSQANFFHTYALLLQGQALGGPQTLESARASRPLFVESLGIAELGRAYAVSANQNMDQIIGALNALLAVQDAIIARAG